MTLSELIPLALKASIMLVVFALGLKANFSDLTYVLSRRGLLIRSLLAMSVIMPVLAVILVKTMSLPSAVAIALVALSLAPVPPVLPKKQIKAGGHASYAIGLLVAASLIAIVWIPLAIELVDPFFPASLHVGPIPIAKLVGMTILLPLAAGAIVRMFTPWLADRISPLASLLGSVLLLAALAAVLIANWTAVIAQARDGTLLAFAAFVLVGLVVGHLLGGPDAEDRTVLGIAAASRHPGVAIAMAHLNYPNEQAVAPAVLLYLVASAILTAPYIAWRKKRAAGV